MPRKARREQYAPRLEPLEVRTLLSSATGERLLVGFTGTAPTRAFDRMIHRVEAQVVDVYPDGLRVIELPPDSNVDAVRSRLARTPGVRYVERDGNLSVTRAISNDPLVGSLWGLDNANDVDIDAPQAWAITTGSPEIIVAVIDSGVDLTHPDLAGRIWVNTREIPGNGRDDDRNGYRDDVNGWNFQARNNDVRDFDGHGTHVSGTIAAVANNGIGVAGVAPGVRIMPLKFFGPSGNGAISDAVSAIYYAVANGARVINASWGGSEYSRALEDAIAYANGRGVVFVTAAGNLGSNNDVRPNYPPNIRQPNVLSVAAIDRDGALANFSNFGANTVHIAAPGVEILSTVNGGGYATYSGTSMATPHVAAVVALVASRQPELSAAQLVERVRASAKPLPTLAGKMISGGIVDADAALTYGTVPSAAQPSPSTMTATDLRALILASEEFHAVNGRSPDGFVNGLYRSLLGRSADPGGLTLWTTYLRTGWTREQVARAILNAEETYRTTVARWFLSDLGRPAASLESLKSEPIVIEWARSLAQGTSPDQIRANILASDEFHAVNGGTNERFVDGLYRAILGRSAEPAGRSHWTGALVGRSRRDVALQILGAPEARQTTIARWFQADLRRPVPLDVLKSDPTILSWARTVRF